MTTAQSWLFEVDQEIEKTRRILERVPEARFAWRPHPKSYTLHDLVGHLANIFSWGTMALGSSELDISKPFPPRRYETTAQVLAEFDRNAAAYRAALSTATDDDLASPWSLKMGATVLFTAPKSGVLRPMVLSHMIHHRGQLSVYLRLLDVPVPSIYGPSADDDPMGLLK